MSAGELTREQLLEYVKKQRAKIKKLETEIVTLKDGNGTNSTNDSASNADVKAELEILSQQLDAKNAELFRQAQLIKSLESKQSADNSAQVGNSYEQRITEIQLKYDDELRQLSSSLREANKKLHDREGSLQDLRDQLQDKNSQIELLSASRSTEIEAVKDQCSKNLESVKQQSSYLEKKVHELTAELTKSINESTSYRETTEDLERQLTEKEKEIQQLRADQGKAKNDEVNKLRDQLQQQFSTLQEELSATKRRETAAQSAVEEASKQLDVLKRDSQEQLHALRSDNNNLLQLQSSLKEEIATKSKDSTEATTLLGRKDKEILQLQTLLQSRTAEESSTGMLNNTKFGSIVLIVVDLGENKKKGKGKKGKNAKAISQDEEDLPAADCSTEEILRLREQLEQVEIELATIRRERDDMISVNEDKLKAAIDKHTIENQNLSEEISRLQDVLDKMQKTLSDKDVAITDLLNKLKALEQEADGYKSMLDEGSTSAASQSSMHLQQLAEKDALVVEKTNQVNEQENILHQVRAKLISAEKSIVGYSRSVMERDAALLDANNQLANHQAESDKKLSNLTLDSENLTKKLSVAQTEVKKYEEELKVLTETHNKQKEEYLLLESTNKKLMTKLKSKMKEVEEASSTIDHLKKDIASASSSSKSTEESIQKELQETKWLVIDLQKKIEVLMAEKSALECELGETIKSQLKCDEINSRLSQDKILIQEEMSSLTNKMDLLIKESNSITAERDDLLRKVTELEAFHRNNSSMHGATIKTLTEEKLAIESKLATLETELSTREKHLSIIEDKCNNLSQDLNDARKEVKNKSEVIDVLQAEAKNEAANYNTKLEAVNDKVRRLQQLLKKVNNSAQEKEAKMNQLISLNERAKRFTIISRLTITEDDIKYNSSNNEFKELLDHRWCLIFEDSPPGEKKESSTISAYRWISENVVHQWIGEGSSVIGNWPEVLNEQWNRKLYNSVNQLERERDELRFKLEDITNSFQTYKLRAQTALKRLGNEERNEKQKVIAAENTEIDRLKCILSDKDEEIDRLSSRIKQLEEVEIRDKDEKVISLSGEIEDLKSELQDVRVEVEKTVSKLKTQQLEYDRLHEEKEELYEKLEDCLKKYSSIRRDHDSLSELLAATNSSISNSVHAIGQNGVDHEKSTTSTISQGIAGANMAASIKQTGATSTLKSLPPVGPTVTIDAQFQKDSGNGNYISRSKDASHDVPSGRESPRNEAKSPSNLMLFQQV